MCIYYLCTAKNAKISLENCFGSILVLLFAIVHKKQKLSKVGYFFKQSSERIKYFFLNSE